MAICDAVVFPYLEVGQSSSGPISQALELGCRVIASRTHTFLQFARYHHNMIEFFDIGNHLELAGRIRARPQFEPRDHLPAFNVETNKAVYLAANGDRAAAAGVRTVSSPHCKLLATIGALRTYDASARAAAIRAAGRNGGAQMRNGFRVYDSDTHVNPAAEVLERYVDPGFRARLGELEPYRFAVGQGAVGGWPGSTIIASGQNTTGGCSASARRARPSPAARRNGWAARCRGPGCRTIRPRTASKTWMTKGPMFIS